MPVVLKHLVYNKLVGGLLKAQIQAVVCVYAKILGFYKAQLRSPEYQLVRAVDGLAVFKRVDLLQMPKAVKLAIVACLELTRCKRHQQCNNNSCNKQLC